MTTPDARQIAEQAAGLFTRIQMRLNLVKTMHVPAHSPAEAVAVADCIAYIESALTDATAKAEEELDVARKELQRIQRLPEMEWAEVGAALTQPMATLARAGHQEQAKSALAAWDKGQTYCNRLRVRAEKAEAQLTDARRAVWEEAANIAANTKLCILSAEVRRDIVNELRQRAKAEESQP